MQKGHLQPTVPILITMLILASLTMLGASAKSSDVGPLIPVNGLSSITGDAGDRPIIGRALPTPPIMMQTKQASGPNPDENLTPQAGTSFEWQPNASPGPTQNRIVFSSNGTDTNNDGRIDTIDPADNDYNLWIMRSDGSEQYMLVDLPNDQMDPCYDPGGRMIVYSQPVNGVWQIFTLEIRDPSIITQITTGPGNKRHPTWSPDDNWIGFQSDVNGTWDIYKTLATGQGNPIQITSGGADDRDPAWSPNGLLIAFTRENAGIKRIYTTDPEGSTIDPVSDGGGNPLANDQDPAWRQGGTELAFASTRFTEAGDVTADLNIWRMAALGEVNGAVPGLVSNTDATDTRDDTDPTWTVDIDRAPTRIVFVSKRLNNQADIWAMQMDDWIWPILTALPTVTPRVAAPGNDVRIRVPVYDRDSGVQQVVAVIKDPDLPKIYDIEFGHYFDSSYQAGVRYLEMDSPTVGQVELLDDDGDGFFEGDWTTPAIANGHDYIVDIVVTDMANNSLTYDDVYGFSTRTFSPQNNILFVNDYCEGQAFISLLGWNNTYFAGFPVETYYTRNPGYHAGNQGTVDFDTIRDSYGDGYDVWRVICRGPVPAAVYQYYQPTIEYQLDPQQLDQEGSLGVTADRPVAVADRAVVWAAPHTGNVWIADGSIMDASTQADVATFVKRGGRLFMAGEDIAWALTLNGTRTNTFLAQTLRARFVADCGVGGPSVFVQYLGRQWRMQGLGGEFGLTGLAGDPVADDPWGGGHYPHTADRPLQINSARITRPNSPWFTDAAQFSMRPDAIEALDAIKIYGMAAGEGVSNFSGPTAGLRYEDTSIENGGRVVYLSVGFEQLHRGYHTEDSFSHCRNLRSHLMHNAMCWMRTGGFQGRVISISDGGQAITGPNPIVFARQGGQIRYAVRCQNDGTYVMQGLPPGYYELQAARPGFEIQHFDGEFVHGGALPRTVDFAIKRAQPGAVSGTVVAAGDGKPLANVTISVAADPDSEGTPTTGLPNPVVTSADGRYTLPYVPAGDYIITADGTAILYGSEEAKTAVAPGDTTTVDFQLGAAPGTLEVRVVDQADNSVKVRNAAVVVTDSQGGKTTAYTDDQGLATVELEPGNYTAVVSAPGYQASNSSAFAIEPAATYVLNVALQQQPGGALTGRVVAGGSGSFIGGVSIRVMFGNEEIASTITSSSAVNPGGATLYNYIINDVPTGQVTVIAERQGFTASPAERVATVVSGATTVDVNFSMQSLFTFPRGLQLVSFPWDYSSVDPATLLGIGANTWGMATWEATRQRYRLYPEAPADRFRLGTGYWMNLTSPADLSQEGIPASDPVEVPLAAGWNLIGCPYNERIDFYTVLVRDQDNIVYTLQQALSNGILGSGLYAYVLGGYQPVGVLSPYTGYWLKTYAPCSLIISSQTGSLAVSETRDATPSVKDGWLLQLKTSVSGLQDTATYFGTARAATSGCDFALDQAKPPVPAVGQYLYTAFDNSKWAQAGGDYAVDVRPAGVKSVWPLKVRTNAVGERVRLSWGDMSGLPNDVRPVLKDLDSGKTIYMRTATAYAFVATKGERNLQITVEPGSGAALTIIPLAAAQTGTGTAISYTLSQAASVEVSIANIAGRVVRQVVAGQMQTAGQNTILWDGRDRSGLQVPDGRYLVTIVGRTDSGQQARTIIPLQKSGR